MTDNAPLSESERAELERLRATVAERGRLRNRARAVLAAVLVTVACVLAPVAVVAVWTSNQVSSTDRYVRTVAPLASDPAIQNAVANRATDVIMRQLNLQQLLPQVVTALEKRGLPPRVGDRLSGLSGPITNGVRDFVRTQTGKVVQSDAFERLWVNGNRLAHQQLTAVLSGKGTKLLKVGQGTVSVDLAPVIDAVKQKLVASGLGAANAIPTVHTSFQLFEPGTLTRAQTMYSVLTTLGWALPVLVLVLIALGIVAARGHRRTLLAAALGVAGAMIVLGFGIMIGRLAYLNALGAHHLDTTAGAVLFDTIVRFLRTGIRAVFALFLVIAAGAYLTGPSQSAAAVRRVSVQALGGLRRMGESRGVSTGPVGRWMYRHRRLLRIGAVAVAALIFLFWNQPTGVVILAIALILLAVLGLIELLARPPSPA